MTAKTKQPARRVRLALVDSPYRSLEAKDRDGVPPLDMLPEPLARAVTRSMALRLRADQAAEPANPGLYRQRLAHATSEDAQVNSERLLADPDDRSPMSTERSDAVTREFEEAVRQQQALETAHAQALRDLEAAIAATDPAPFDEAAVQAAGRVAAVLDDLEQAVRAALDAELLRRWITGEGRFDKLLAEQFVREVKAIVDIVDDALPTA